MLLEVPEDLSLLDGMLEELPNRPAVFLLWARQGEPYLARTVLLRRRLLRLLRERGTPSRILNLRHTVTRIEYRLAASSLESSLLLYELARRHFPKRYLEVLKLRMPPYVKITLGNRFPRSQVTAQVGSGSALYFGPFRSRASAERFESEFLDLFQMRRCEEELVPSPEHPGCIYGEMGMCLRPCQQVVGEDEYRHEAQRVIQFLATGGRSLVEPLVAARDRLSEELNFEEAARQHRRLDKIQEVLKLRDELCQDVSRLNGVAITASTQANAVELWFFYQGCWQPPQSFSLEVMEGKSVSLDEKIRRTVAELEWRGATARERQEHLALLARWCYSSWRDGEWLAFESPDKIPYRRLVRAISRVASKVKAAG